MNQAKYDIAVLMFSDIALLWNSLESGLLGLGGDWAQQNLTTYTLLKHSEEYGLLASGLPNSQTIRDGTKRNCAGINAPIIWCSTQN
jgi:hypothetical protein